ncbi:transcription factor Zn, C2H2 [Ophiocordyceps camponoti-floridani]|uniref:Transcription factor Zn, C2H2 n=1 Tax=Ophiocordyceps camponoti-floridani TaxID=2030778 RepID=A0A8H4Q138_9HYPO|nr:transcription factor Zn, C2H2 [Ophiocordyceps camponoti-floridani]
MSAIAIQFDPAFTMGPRSAFSWPGPLEPYSSGGSSGFGAEINNRIMSSESSLTPPSETRSLASSPPRAPWTPGQLELKRQSDRARRDLKLSARIQRSNSDSFAPSPPVALGDVPGAIGSLSPYATTTPPPAVPALPTSTMGNPSFLSPFTSAMSEQPQGGQVFNPAPYHPSMQSSYGVTMEYPAAYGEYSARMPLSHEAGMLYPMQSVSTSGGQEDSQVRVVQSRPKPRCWEHGCNGRQFSTFSNLLRHQREKSGQAAKATCPNCGAEFTRTTARNGHLLHEKCKQRRNT